MCVCVCMYIKPNKKHILYNIIFKKKVCCTQHHISYTLAYKAPESQHFPRP